MEHIFKVINDFFEFIVPISDFLWDFPTNIEFYSKIPILGKFSFALILLVGTGIFFSVKTKFVQITKFKTGLKILIKKKTSDIGVSPLASFLLSSATRVGPGNIMGVTGAISVGGPGAVFWMWVSAFFGMATAFAESVLAQVFKEQDGDNYIGGLPFYGKKILGNKRAAGILLSVCFILYALFTLPGQTFHLFTALGSVAEVIGGVKYERTSSVYYIIAAVIFFSVLFTTIGGIRRVTKVTDVLVPIMAVIYMLIVLFIICINLKLIPYFFTEVIRGAFSPRAIFGGAFGVALAQGIKRGLMSNEAGQGTITMAAAVADNEHPCEQGFVQSIGVFLDTIVICTLTGFVVVLAHLWSNGASGVEWEAIKNSKLDVYLNSIQYLIPGQSLDAVIKCIVSLCYGLFAFTTLIGLILFTEISGSFISTNKHFIFFLRLLGAVLFVPFGELTVLSGLELGNLWYISDFINIMIVYANVPVILLGTGIVTKTLDHYIRTNGKKFISKEIGIDTEVWK